ncbi:SAM-dependent methyltransferase [Micromonospora radicis]|uniref:Methyltransferase domain-containing protein n=1 Tax=Micromonospora radicis TaxID=1894971 RepID=A0A418MSI2_9ACTN|nr:class I SAM-dependent methyltransferase [Micromonospora radicis]RIV37045.1 methyltransferase domain-containing protein [Micromonospora radicis]
MVAPSRAGAEHVTHVADYYDSNTRRFLLVAESPTSDAIHRGVWLPGTPDVAAAADAVNRLVIERLRGHVPPGGRVLDLGCGVGGTMTRLAQEMPVAVSGVTISQVQADIATKRFAKAGLSERCQVLCADFGQLPAEPRYDAMVAIESMVHSPSLATLIPSLAERLKPGGRLLMIDDWMTDEDLGLAARERCLERFRAGWRIGGLHTVPGLTGIAEGAGLRLVESMDLTPYLHLGRPRDRLIKVAVGATGLLRIRDRLVERPFWANMIGGSALQTALAHRWLEYRLILLEKPERH